VSGKVNACLNGSLQVQNKNILCVEVIERMGIKPGCRFDPKLKQR
jgi:hypothetical protein